MFRNLKGVLKKLPLVQPLLIWRASQREKYWARKQLRLQSKIQLSGQAASDLIYQGLMADEPFLVARFGSVEIYVALLTKLRRRSPHLLNDSQIQALGSRGGFYPLNVDNLERFYRMSLELMPRIDILGSWCTDEMGFEKELKNAVKIPLGDIEPYMHERPWTKALAGKKVLVINPLTKSIEQQFTKRTKIFANPEVLPDFELITYKPVFEMNAADRCHESWFAALHKMQAEISAIDFDMAIIGCGPYGIFLGDHIKAIGRKAVVMGGATQVWFGIKGGRWDVMPFFPDIYNEHWTYPLDCETPKNFMEVEGGTGCYWKKA